MSSPAYGATRRPLRPALRLTRRLEQQNLPLTREALAEAPMEPGRAASVEWCRANISPLRGASESTVLPVGMGIEALRFGMRMLARARDKGLPVKNPIAFVVIRARRVHNGQVTVSVPVSERITWH